MNGLLKNWLSLSRLAYWTFVLVVCPFVARTQIANFVKNGSFEEKYNCNYPNQLNKAKGWSGIGADTTKFGCPLLAVNCYSNAPVVLGTGFQYPRSGTTFCSIQVFCTVSCDYTVSRGYPKNRLKSNLIAGRTYCVKMYVSLVEASPYAISNLALYFSDNSIDTIQNGYSPVTYVTPQVKNPINNIITDTLNWVPIMGTYTATGNEKYLVLGNFEPDATTTKTLVGNPSEVWTEYWLDDVSCIDIDLPAFAGNDTSFIPGSTIYIGRQRDVGIDEACIWYKLPNMTTSLDTAAGIFVSPIVTSTYVVRQEICGNVKWDTVVVHETALGLNQLSILNESIKVYPVPAQDEINLQFTLPNMEGQFNTVAIYNNLGQLIRLEEIAIKNKTAIIKTDNLLNGVYMLRLESPSTHYDKLSGGSSGQVVNNQTVSKRFVITR